MIRDFTKGPILSQLILFALPLMGANLLQIVYNMVDMAVIGQFDGKIGLSAVSVGGEVLTLITFFAVGFSTAGQVILSQMIGAGRRDRISATIGTMFVVLLTGAVVISVVCGICVRPMLDAMNTPPEAFSAALQYARICSSGLIFIYGYNLIGAILRGMGDSRHPFLFIGLATVVNLGLDLLFVAGFQLGPAGAALATILGQGTSFICSLVLLYRRRAAFGFDFQRSSFQVDREILLQLLKLGLPMSLQSAAVTISIIFVSSFLNEYGVVVSAVSGLGFKVCTIISVITMALASAGSSIVGQNLGAGKNERVSCFFWLSLRINVCVAAVFSCITLLFPRFVFGIFTNDTAVLDMGMTFLPCAVLDYFGFALRSPTNSIVNGSGHARFNLFMGVMDGIVCRVSIALFLGIVMDMGVQGFWYGSALAGFVPFLIGFGFYLSGKWRQSNDVKGRT